MGRRVSVLNLPALIFEGWIACGSLGLWWEMRAYLQGKHAMPEVIERMMLDRPRFIATAALAVLFGPLSLALLAGMVAYGKLSFWLPIAQNRFAGWRLERGFRRAERRMQRCKHERTMMTDCGSGLCTPKCLDCWALCFGKTCGGDDFWTPNSASPRQARRMTETIQRGGWCAFCEGTDFERRTLYGGEGPDGAAEQWTCRGCGAGTWLYCDGTHAPWQPAPTARR